MRSVTRSVLAFALGSIFAVALLARCGVPPANGEAGQVITAKCDQDIQSSDGMSTLHYAKVLIPSLSLRMAPNLSVWLCDCSGPECQKPICRPTSHPIGNATADLCQADVLVPDRACQPAGSQNVIPFDGGVIVACGESPNGGTSSMFQTIVVRSN